MRRIKALPVLVASLVLASTLGIAAGGGDDGGGGEQTLNLVIGDSLPLTGDLSDFGPPGRKAADLAIDEIRKAIDQAGVDHRVRITHEDNQTDPGAAVQVARKMVADGASCIIGAWASADTIPTARSVSIREEVLQITPASTSDEITGLNDDGLVNRTAPPDRFQGPALANAIEQDLDGAQGKTVNVGARNDAYGTGLAKTFGDAWKEKGGEIGEQVIYDPEQPSYNSEAERIAGGNPDAYVIIDFPETYAKVGPALVRTGNWDPKKTWGTDGIASGGLPEDAGAEATEGIRGTAPGAPERNPEPAVAFDRLYNQSAPRNIQRQTFDAQNFDAVVLCYLAAVAAGSTDGKAMADEVRNISAPPGDRFDWRNMSDAIRALQDGNDIDYTGASGGIDMNEDGDATSGVYDLYRFRNGELEIYSELPIPEQ
jgi:ABC-type branched-subunit amino acid transport system substrate-binding protein